MAIHSEWRVDYMMKTRQQESGTNEQHGPRAQPLQRPGRTSVGPYKTTYHLCGLVVGFVGQSAIFNTAVAALVTVLSFIWCIAAISFQGSPHKRLAAQSYR